MGAISTGIKKHKPISKKKKNNHEKIALLAKTKIDSIDVLISKSLFDSYISHDEFVLVNNVSEEYDDLREEIKNLKT